MKLNELSESAPSKCCGSYDVTNVYGWYSESSVWLEDPGVY